MFIKKIYFISVLIISILSLSVLGCSNLTRKENQERKVASSVSKVIDVPGIDPVSPNVPIDTNQQAKINFFEPITCVTDWSSDVGFVITYYPVYEHKYKTLNSVEHVQFNFKGIIQVYRLPSSSYSWFMNTSDSKPPVESPEVPIELGISILKEPLIVNIKNSTISKIQIKNMLNNFSGLGDNSETNFTLELDSINAKAKLERRDRASTLWDYLNCHNSINKWAKFIH